MLIDSFNLKESLNLRAVFFTLAVAFSIYKYVKLTFGRRV